MRLVTSVLLLLVCPPASATSTMFMFDPPSTAPVPSLEFLGYEAIGSVLVHGREGPRSLPAGSWNVLDFDEHSATIHVAYINPGDPSLPGSFTLKGQEEHTRLATGGSTPESSGAISSHAAGS